MGSSTFIILPRMIHMPKMPDERMPFCSPDQYEKCADPALDELVQKDNSVCVCTTPCSVRRYSKEVSLLKLPSDSSVDYLSVKFKKTPEYIKERIIHATGFEFDHFLRLLKVNKILA